MDEELSSIDVINIFASVSSIVLAVVALSLSIYFFKQSLAEAKQSKSSAHEISASVTRLEKLFDTLYSDTFSMMRDTVTDMRQHIWTKSQADEATNSLSSADEGALVGELAELRNDLLQKIELASAEAGIASDKVAQLGNRVAELVDQTLGATVKAGEEDAGRFGPDTVVRERLRKSAGNNPVPIERLVKYGERLGFEEHEIISALFNMRSAGEVTWDGPDGVLEPKNRASLVE